jgi:hypothetical protein
MRWADKVPLIKQDGRRFENIPADVSPKEIHTDEATLPIEDGDHFERVLSNGLVETYLVLDRGFYEREGPFPAHYQVAVRNVTAISPSPTSSHTHNYLGHNQRINTQGPDYSTNVVNIGAGAGQGSKT